MFFGMFIRSFVHWILSVLLSDTLKQRQSSSTQTPTQTVYPDMLDDCLWTLREFLLVNGHFSSAVVRYRSVVKFRTIIIIFMSSPFKQILLWNFDECLELIAELIVVILCYRVYAHEVFEKGIIEIKWLVSLLITSTILKAQSLGYNWDTVGHVFTQFCNIVVTWLCHRISIPDRLAE